MPADAQQKAQALYDAARDLKLALSCLNQGNAHAAAGLIAEAISRVEGRPVAGSSALNTEAERLRAAEDLARYIGAEGKDNG